MTIVLLVLSCSAKGQKGKIYTDEQIKIHQEDSILNRESLSDSETISVKWKIKPDETIGYKTAMEQIESSDFNMSFGDDEKIPKEEFKEIFDGLKKEFEKTTSFITTMQWNDRGNIETKMFTENFNEKASRPFDTKNFNTTGWMKGVVLRGEINRNGQIESFYLKSAQKNLIAMFFELPNKPIKLGDSWSLNVSYLQFDQSFVCESAKKTNNVELIDILKENSDTIVIFKYNISESASGYMKNPLNNENIETALSIKFDGIAEFSVTKGCWITYNGILETTQKGMLSGSSKQKLALIPFDNLTKEMINIE